MKKFICYFISVFLVTTSCSFSVFARGNEMNFSPSETSTDMYQSEQIPEASKTSPIVHNKNAGKKDSIEEKFSKAKGKDVSKETAEKKDKVKEKINEKVKEKRKKNDHSIPVFIKDKEVKFDVPPVIKSGRTLIPVRAITNSLGADVEWDAKTQTVTVSKAVYDSVYGVSTTVVTLKLDSDIILVNGKEVKIDVPAQLVSNRTMVPIRFIAQALNQEIEYDSETGAVIVDEEEEEYVDVDNQIEAFKNALKHKHKDKFERKALIRKISDLKKKKNNMAIMVFVKGSEVEFDVSPVIKSGRTLIPVGAVSGALGADVDWDSKTKTITITKSVYGENDTVIEINLDSDIVLVNGKEVKIDVPAQLVNNRTMVPIRFIAVVLKQEVEFDPETGAIIIEDDDEEDDTDEDEKVAVDDEDE